MPPSIPGPYNMSLFCAWTRALVHACVCALVHACVCVCASMRVHYFLYVSARRRRDCHRHGIRHDAAPPDGEEELEERYQTKLHYTLNEDE